MTTRAPGSILESTSGSFLASGEGLTSLGLVVALLNLGCGPSREQVGRVIERGAPLVQAIRTYESDTGQPPPSLDALVPKYLPAVPTTGLEAFPEYGYTVDRERPHRWRLSVRMESLGFKHMHFDPSRQYEIPVTELRDGWVMITP